MFCDEEYESVLKYIPVYWLSLERCINRVLIRIVSVLCLVSPCLSGAK